MKMKYHYGGYAKRFIFLGLWVWFSDYRDNTVVQKRFQLQVGIKGKSLVLSI